MLVCAASAAVDTVCDCHVLGLVYCIAIIFVANEQLAVMLWSALLQL